VAVGLTLLLASPVALGARPAAQPAVSAQDLLAGVRASTATPYSGYAQSTGGLGLPVTAQLNALTNLLGDTTTTRAWFRGPQEFRVGTVTLTGERDLYRSPTGTWTWDYESNRAVLFDEPAVRLPREADLLPSALGQRLLSEADPTQVSRLPAERIAGRDAPGLRLIPSDPRTTITEVDVWVDPGSGVPLKVLVRGADPRPVMSTTFLDFSTTVPDATVTSFAPPPGSSVSRQAATDLAALANRFSDAVPPAQLAGLAQRERLAGTAGAVGTYGQGLTTLTAVPLRARDGRSLRTQLATTPGAVTDANGLALSIGPVNLRVTNPASDGHSWVLAGTVTSDTLTTAARDLLTGAAP